MKIQNFLSVKNWKAKITNKTVPQNVKKEDDFTEVSSLEEEEGK